MKSLVFSTFGILSLSVGCAVDTGSSHSPLDNGDGVGADTRACAMNAASVAEDPPPISIDTGERVRTVIDIFRELQERPDDPFVQLAAEYATTVLNVNAGIHYGDEAIDAMVMADDILSSRDLSENVTDDVEDVALSEEMRRILSRANSFAAESSPCREAPAGTAAQPIDGDRSAPENFDSEWHDTAPEHRAGR